MDPKKVRKLIEELSARSGDCRVQGKKKFKARGTRSTGVIDPKAKIRKVANEGIRDHEDMRRFLSAVIEDLLSARITPAVGNRLTAEIGRMLRSERKPDR